MTIPKQMTFNCFWNFLLIVEPKVHFRVNKNNAIVIEQIFQAEYS
jgi:hypothetical protein